MLAVVVVDIDGFKVSRCRLLPFSFSLDFSMTGVFSLIHSPLSLWSVRIFALIVDCHTAPEFPWSRSGGHSPGLSCGVRT